MQPITRSLLADILSHHSLFSILYSLLSPIRFFSFSQNLLKNRKEHPVKNHNLRRLKFSTLSDQERAILVGEICALVDTLLDLLIAVEAGPPFNLPTVGRELAAPRQPPGPRRRDGRTDDNFDVPRRIEVKPPSQSKRSERSEPRVQYPLAYPLRTVWDKKIRTNLN